jgi:hypothetical protein
MPAQQVEIAQPEGFVVTRIMTREERIAAIQELVATIPADKDGLYSWEIKWSYLDDVLLSHLVYPTQEAGSVLDGQVGGNCRQRGEGAR